jgi:hypothetical protein
MNEAKNKKEEMKSITCSQMKSYGFQNDDLVILKAITSITPDLRYLVGSNSLIEKRKSVPERNFLEFMSQNILGSGNRLY